MTLTTTILIELEAEVEVEIEVDSDHNIESVDLRSAVVEELPVPQGSKLHNVIQSYLNDNTDQLEDAVNDKLDEQSQPEDDDND